MSLKLLFIQLNEINFEIAERYILASKAKFRNLRKIKKYYRNFLTHAEDEYNNLEPWIQWPSIHLGKSFDQHEIFRLGDIKSHPNQKQLFETLEDEGFSIGAISPMNADNRLKNPAYFISDPWTDTPSDPSGFSKRVSSMLKQTVNDNAKGGLTTKSIFTIFEIFFKTLNYKNSLYLIKLILSSLLNPWKKSLVLDYLIHLAHMYLLKKKEPNFSSVFFNAGAHIQHHYFFNTKHIKNLPTNPKWYVNPSSDPIEDMLDIYDRIIGDYLNFSEKGCQILIATGLRQVPYNKAKFYYRLKEHTFFLNKIGVKFLKILPRMTRDFEIIFTNDNDLIIAKKILEKIKSKKDNLSIFTEIEERKKSLFVTLTYPNEINKSDNLVVNENLELNFFDEVIFVAIKNGMHDTNGYVFCSPNINFKIPKSSVHVSKLHNMILGNFLSS
tara:strand:+ start:1826 stop:3145 length:1320 start_codon:yes stop_codon:yes gene_type:complete